MIGFIGAGKAGCSLARYFRKNGEEISGFYSRTAVPGDFARYDTTDELVKSSDMIFITVSDSAIGTVWNGLDGSAVCGKLIYHISGAESSEVFCGADPDLVCSAHPLLAFSTKETPAEQIKRAFFTLEGGDTAVKAVSELLDRCGNRYAVIKPEIKPLYHAAACFASNLVTAVCAEAEKMLCRCGFAEEDALSALAPLIEENVRNVCENGIRPSLTGPVSRGDAETVEKHLAVLEGRDREIYMRLSAVLAEISGHTELLSLLQRTDHN